jgi:hypothetical protein
MGKIAIYLVESYCGILHRGLLSIERLYSQAHIMSTGNVIDAFCMRRAFKHDCYDHRQFLIQTNQNMDCVLCLYVPEDFQSSPGSSLKMCTHNRLLKEYSETKSYHKKHGIFKTSSMVLP